VTWPFVYLVLLVVGLVGAGVTVVLRRLPLAFLRHPVSVPKPEQHFTFASLVTRRASVGLASFGLIGLVLSDVRPLLPVETTASIALGGALAATLLAMLLLRSPCGVLLSRQSRAEVIREVPPGGYGQVRLFQEGRAIVMAAKNVGPRPIPAGSTVEVLDCESSVLSVRFLAAGSGA
jgi:hypothetical protein